MEMASGPTRSKLAGETALLMASLSTAIEGGSRAGADILKVSLGIQSVEKRPDFQTLSSQSSLGANTPLCSLLTQTQLCSNAADPDSSRARLSRGVGTLRNPKIHSVYQVLSEAGSTVQHDSNLFSAIGKALFPETPFCHKHAGQTVSKLCLRSCVP